MTPSILDRLLAISSLYDFDRHRAMNGTPLTEARVQCLWALHHGGPTTQQALSKSFGTTPRSVSALVDGLIEVGYVERTPHPDDRRAVLVSLTPAAEKLMRSMQRDRTRLSADLLEAVEPADREAFERGVDAVFWKLNQVVRSAGSK